MNPPSPRGASAEEQPDDLSVTPSDGDRHLVAAANTLPPARISTVTDALNVPVAWLDGLLLVLQDVPFDQGEAALVSALTAAFERLIPRVEVRIQLVAPEHAPITQQRRMQWTEPPKSKERLRSARAFPDAPYERWVLLPGERLGALHFASEDDLFASESSPYVQVLDRAALVAAQALARLEGEERVKVLRKELRTVESQMVQTEKLASLGQIAAGMVHELNNPLTSIAAYTDFLIRRGTARGADEDDLERLRRIADSASRMLRFTRDLVSYARPPADIPISVQLNIVVERALAFCEHEIVGAAVVVERAFDGDMGPIRGLPEQLAQVFVNLFTNACHAMTASGDGAPSRSPVLTVSTRGASAGSDGRVTVTVEDTGSGISKDHLGLIFTPFFTTKAAGRGTGLGLSIVKKIVEGHGGEIRAESDPQTGTRFVLTFPVA